MKYHAYLCYNSTDNELVKSFFELLTNSGLRIFFDSTIKQAGQSIDKIELGLSESQSLIYLISKAGDSGFWQEREYKQFITLYNIYDNSRRIFVVLLENIESNIIPKALMGFERYEYFDKVNYDSKNIFRLTQELQPTNALFQRFTFERPLLKNVYKSELLNPTLQWYSDNADLFYETWKNDIPEDKLIGFIREVKKNTKGKPYILDAGCGPGHHSIYLAKEGFNVVGIDFAHGVLKIAEKNKIANTEFRFGDMRNLETIYEGARNIFDGIWAAGSCVHINMESLVLQFHQFMAHIKPNGILGVTFQIGFDSEIEDDRRFFERYRNSQIIRKKLEEANFMILSETFDYNGKSTTKRKIKTWVCFIAQAPAKKVLLYPPKKVIHF